MSVGPVVDTPALAKMRSAFDQSFTVHGQGRTEPEPVIQIRAGRDVFAIRTGQIAGLVKSRKIVPLPSRIPELLGVAALRGSLIPVYDLAALLGISSGGAGLAWLLLVPGETPIGLAFDEFEGQQAPEWVSQEQDAHEPVRQLVRMGSAVSAVLDIPGIAEAIRKRAGFTEPAKETK